jgi:hypothetical protein
MERVRCAEDVHRQIEEHHACGEAQAERFSEG